MTSRDALKNAAAAFETQFRCRLCLHDYTGRLPGGILPRYHLNPYCTSLKAARPRLHGICFAFDRFAVREHWEKKQSFTVKQCPCGFLEAVFPILCNDRIAGCLFAGPFAPDDPGSGVRPDLLSSPVKYAAPRNIRKADSPPGMPRDFDAFRAYGELIASQIALLANAESVSEPRSDRERILRFLEQHYERNIGLDDAAELLDLSPARASDRVRRLFGKDSAPCCANAGSTPPGGSWSSPAFPRRISPGAADSGTARIFTGSSVMRPGSLPWNTAESIRLEMSDKRGR